MKAIYFENAGSPLDVLTLGDLPKPVLRAGELLVKMLASPVHPADLFFIAGTYRLKPEFPQTAGLEGTGLVEEPGDTGIPRGTLVSFLYKNAWAEYAAIPKRDLLVLPDSFPVESAAQFTLNPFTAWGLLEKAGLNAGDWLLLTAASSAVAKLIIQFALRKGINVIAAVKNLSHQEELEHLGAVVIKQQLQADILNEQIKTITGNTGLQCVMDPVGGETATHFLGCLGVNGKFIVYGRMDPGPAMFYHADINYKNLTITGFGIRAYLEQITSHKNETAKEIIAVMMHQGFSNTKSSKYRIAEFREVFEDFKRGNAVGKKILIFPALEGR